MWKECPRDQMTVEFKPPQVPLWPSTTNHSPHHNGCGQKSRNTIRKTKHKTRQSTRRIWKENINRYSDNDEGNLILNTLTHKMLHGQFIAHTIYVKFGSDVT